MRLAATLLCLGLLAAGCSDDGEDGSGAPTDVCDRLPIEVASAVVGVDYTANGQRTDICFYQRPGTDQAFGLRVLSYRDGFDTVVEDAEGLGYDSSAIEVPGADRAVALSGRLRSVVAEQDGEVFEVAFNGAAETAGRLMAVVLGGEDPGPATEEVANPCRSLSAAQVRRLLGVPPEAEPGAREVALKSCTWRGERRELVVAAGRGRGPVEEFWDENLFVGQGTEPEQVRVPGADGALLVSTKGDETVGLAVAIGDLSYVVTVTGPADTRAAAIRTARALLSGA